MNLSIVLLAALLTVNVISVLCLLFAAAGSKKPLRAATAAPEHAPQRSIEEAERPAAEALTGRPSGEKGLEEALERWRRGGKGAPAAAGYGRFGYSA